jgi:ABC-type nickel/cobalt efflux system permease component RcnA
MASETAEKITVSDGPEFRMMGNLFGIIIALGGLLVGTMFKERSFDYWMDDLVPLIILFFSSYRFYRNAIDLAREAAIYTQHKEQVFAAMARAATHVNDEMELPKLAAKPQFSEEEVLDAVTRRIQENRATSDKK